MRRPDDRSAAAALEAKTLSARPGAGIVLFFGKRTLPEMPTPLENRATSKAVAGPEFDLNKAWADSRHSPALVYRMWHALYTGYGLARKQFPNVDWISLIAILDIIAVARANRRRVDISYLAAEMGWPRTTALRRLECYARSGYLTLTREGRHTYVDNTRESRRAALRMIDALIDSIDRVESHKQIRKESGAAGPERRAAPPLPPTDAGAGARRLL